MSDAQLTPSTHVRWPLVGMIAAFGVFGSGVWSAAARLLHIEAKQDRADERMVDLLGKVDRLERIDPNSLVDRCVALVLARQQSLDCYRFGVSGRLRCTIAKE